MPNNLKQAGIYSEAAFLSALDAEEQRQARISLFVDEILWGKPVTCRINLRRVQLTISDVVDHMNSMLEQGQLEAKTAEVNLIRYIYAWQDETMLDDYSNNVSMAAHELVSKHYQSIIEEAAIDNAV